MGRPHGSYLGVPHYEGWRKKSFGPFSKWEWAFSTPTHEDLTIIVKYGEYWFKDAETKIIWVEK